MTTQIEREMGSGGFLLTYAAAGVFGNILGGNFALVGAPSVGASGAIFGTLAVSPSSTCMAYRLIYPRSLGWTCSPTGNTIIGPFERCAFELRLSTQLSSYH